MRIAIASPDTQPGSVFDQAGRAPCYLVFDEAGDLLETVSNPFAVGGGGAGFGVAKMLADKSVDIVVAGKFGGNMEQAMADRGLAHLVFSGTVAEAIGKATS